MTLDPRLERLLGYANPYAASEPLLEPAAHPRDFLGTDPAQCRWLFERMQLPLDRDEIAAALERDTAPIPAPANREHYNGDHHFAYWLSGYLSYRTIAAIAARHGVNGGAYFDFGGSTGRLFRHFHFQQQGSEVWSCDFKLSSVEWNLKHFPTAIKAFQNTYFPYLPLEDRAISLITAMSVFTHIDETETAWLLELRRILKPGGVALITIHDEHTWHVMPEDLRNKVARLRPDLAGFTDLPEGRHVSTWRIDDPYRCDVFHSANYIRRNWGRYFAVREIVHDLLGHQAAVVLQRE
jgi:SAM-dependent methyltransferase